MTTPPCHSTLLDAIPNKLQVTFRYHSENSQQDEPTDRVVEPWIYGMKNGKESLLGWQVSGGEAGIRRYDMRRVKTVRLTGDHVDNHPDAPADPTKWDEIFATLDHKSD